MLIIGEPQSESERNVHCREIPNDGLPRTVCMFCSSSLTHGHVQFSLITTKISMKMRRGGRAGCITRVVFGLNNWTIGSLLGHGLQRCFRNKRQSTQQTTVKYTECRDQSSETFQASVKGEYSGWEYRWVGISNFLSCCS